MIGIELTPEEPLGDLRKRGVAAERAGFDTVFTSCHYNNRDPFVLLGQLAQCTETIRLGPGVINPLEIHPVRLASSMATLSETSDGRAVFGIGPGDRSTLANLGLADERGLRVVLETLTTARRLWNGERVSHNGLFTANNAGLNYEASSPPVYVGGEGPHMCRMAAKHADGLLFNGAHPDDLRWAHKQVEIGLEERPATHPAFDFAAYAAVSIARESERAIAAVRPPVAFITAGAPAPVLERHELNPTIAEEIGTAIERGAFSEAFDLVTPAMIEAFSVAGTPAVVREQLDALTDITDSIVIAAPLGPDPDEAIELLADALGDRLGH
ncbi:5,10-methylenetetrahydromethanopterin reductase [Halocatena halophila]|uniref:5,10-methylenetetrahydromethanopterin reductase n=1 Tax=Halocatena halophila TaxID=2814576 RepID=UPI002ED430F9